MDNWTFFCFTIDGMRYNENLITCRLFATQTYEKLKQICKDSHIQCFQRTNEDETFTLNLSMDNKHKWLRMQEDH